MQGTAVLVTTHYLEEAEQCNRLGLMVAGELLVEGTPTEIKAQQVGHLLEFRVDQPQRAADLLKSETQHWRVALFGNRLHTSSRMATSKRGFARIRRSFEAGGVHVMGGARRTILRSKMFLLAWSKRLGKPARSARKSRGANDAENFSAGSKGIDSTPPVTVCAVALALLLPVILLLLQTTAISLTVKDLPIIVQNFLINRRHPRNWSTRFASR